MPSHKDVYIPIPETVNVTLVLTKDFAAVIKVKYVEIGRLSWIIRWTQSRSHDSLKTQAFLSGLDKEM